jgi:hypothetical protein
LPLCRSAFARVTTKGRCKRPWCVRSNMYRRPGVPPR